MSITFDSDVSRNFLGKEEPCLCAQMAEVWGDFFRGEDSPEIRKQLRQEADPKCAMCKGSGIEKVQHDDAPTINLANENAKILFAVLGLPFDWAGEIDIPTARRAVMR